MTALPTSGSFAMVDPTHVKAVGPAAAILFARIAWRSEESGEWLVTREDLREETGLSEAMLRTATRVLRDAGWITTRRSSSTSPTLIWAPVLPGQDDSVESTPTECGIDTHPVDESSVTSIETDEELPLVVPIDTAPSRRKAPKRATQLPDDFRPQPAHFTLAASLGVDLRVDGPKFVDYHRAKGSTMKDWDAALRNWIRNAATYAAQRSGPATTADGAGYIPPARTDPFTGRY